MNEQPDVDETLTFWQQHRFLLLIAATIVVAIILVSISLFIYKASGASQLDLSRPGYIGVSKEATNNESDFTDFSDTGPVNKSTMTQFKQLYDKQVQANSSVDSFGGDPLNPDTLEFSQPTQQ
jgi:hypothetical protein